MACVLFDDNIWLFYETFYMRYNLVIFTANSVFVFGRQARHQGAYIRDNTRTILKRKFTTGYKTLYTAWLNFYK